MDVLQERLAAAESPEWYLELVGAALEKTEDIDKAMQIADAVVEEMPFPPASDEDQELHAVLDALADQASGNQKSYDAKAAPKRPYTTVCPRDNRGHCKPKGTANDPKAVKREKATVRRAELFAAKRVGTGNKARLVMADGGKPPAHLPANKIPPAWTDLMVARDPNSDLLATGADAKGRRQMLFSDAHHMRASAVKFARTRELMEKLGDITAANAKNRSSKDPAVREAADCLALIIAHGFRPGSNADTKGSKKAYGATTLRSYHVVQSGSDVWLRFTGKKGVPQSHRITNPGLAKMLLARKKAAEPTRGEIFGVTDKQLLDYVHGLDGGGFITKDFRTAKGTSIAIELVSKIKRKPKTERDYKRKVKEICAAVSRVLGNEPAQAFKSYIDPTVWLAIKPE